MSGQKQKLIEVIIQLTLEDYRHGLQSHAPIKTSVFVGVGILMVLSGGAWWFFFKEIVALILMVAGAVIALNGLLRWTGLRRQFERDEKLSLPHKFTVTAHGIDVTAQYGSSHIEWGGFVRYVENNQIFLLYAQPLRFYGFPKRCFTPEQLEEFGQMVRAKVPARPASKPAAANKH
jgi:hypothetical protein